MSVAAGNQRSVYFHEYIQGRPSDELCAESLPSAFGESEAIVDRLDLADSGNDWTYARGDGLFEKRRRYRLQEIDNRFRNNFHEWRRHDQRLDNGIDNVRRHDDGWNNHWWLDGGRHHHGRRHDWGDDDQRLNDERNGRDAAGFQGP